MATFGNILKIQGKTGKMRVKNYAHYCQIIREIIL